MSLDMFDAIAGVADDKTRANEDFQILGFVIAIIGGKLLVLFFSDKTLHQFGNFALGFFPSLFSIFSDIDIFPNRKLLRKRFELMLQSVPIDLELTPQRIDGSVGIHDHAIAQACGTPNGFVTVSGDPNRRRRFLQRAGGCGEVGEFIVLAGEIHFPIRPEIFDDHQGFFEARGAVALEHAETAEFPFAVTEADADYQILNLGNQARQKRDNFPPYSIAAEVVLPRPDRMEAGIPRSFGKVYDR